MARSSRTRPLLVVLLGLLLGLGGWNFHRNWTLEQEERRPFGSYSLEELETLRAAYGSEVDAQSARYDAARSRNVAVGGDGTLGHQVAEFERVQRISQGKRAIASAYAENRVQLDAVEAEIAHREAQGTGVMRILRLATQMP